MVRRDHTEADSENDALTLGERDNLSLVSKSKKAASGAAAMPNPSDTIHESFIQIFHHNTHSGF